MAKCQSIVDPESYRDLNQNMSTIFYSPQTTILKNMTHIEPFNANFECKVQAQLSKKDRDVSKYRPVVMLHHQTCIFRPCRVYEWIYLKSCYTTKIFILIRSQVINIM